MTNLSLVLACVIDVITALVPQFLIWDLRMKRSTKLSLDVVFALGLITAVLSIGRVASMNLGVWATDTSCTSKFALNCLFSFNSFLRALNEIRHF